MCWGKGCGGGMGGEGLYWPTLVRVVTFPLHRGVKVLPPENLTTPDGENLTTAKRPPHPRSLTPSAPSLHGCPMGCPARAFNAPRRDTSIRPQPAKPAVACPRSKRPPTRLRWSATTQRLWRCHLLHIPIPIPSGPPTDPARRASSPWSSRCPKRRFCRARPTCTCSYALSKPIATPRQPRTAGVRAVRPTVLLKRVCIVDSSPPIRSSMIKHRTRHVYDSSTGLRLLGFLLRVGSCRERRPLLSRLRSSESVRAVEHDASGQVIASARVAVRRSHLLAPLSR